MRRALVVAAVLCASVANANPERYLICHEEEELRSSLAVTTEPARNVESDWVKLPKKRPPRLEAAKLEVFDVAESDPMPSRRVATKPPRQKIEEEPLVAIESKNDFRCIGIPRGTAGILRTISAPPGSRFYGQPYLESWRQDNMVAAGKFNLSRAIPLLRRTLDRPIPKNIEPWQEGELTRSKHAAARALADLGDTASAGRVLALLRSLERDGFNLWRDTLDSLPRLDPALAQKYALELIDRALKKPDFLAQNATLYTDLLPLIQTPSADALAILRRASDMSCEVLAARVRLGDTELTKELRAELNTNSLDTQRAVACYSILMPVLYPGRDASELDVLMHRHRYHEILTWLLTAPSDASAKQRLHAWLTKRSSEPDVAGDRTRSDFIPEKRAMHLAALAALGDAEAKKKLDALIADPKDEGTAPWLAAYWALRLELDGAADLATKRLRIALRQHTQRFSTELWPTRGFTTITEHGRVVDELVKRGDERFVLGLLDRDAFTRELTMGWLAKKQPKNACRIVGDAAHDAEEPAINDAFWALSVLGDRCRETMQELVNDAKQPQEVRGMANEHLAMLRDKRVPEHNTRLWQNQRFHATVERARIIYRAPE